MSSNPYLEDNYGPIGHETTATDLRVEGELPRELDGLYLRNGPDPIPPIDAANHHWFLGDGMVHGVRLRGGRAEWYRSRWVGSRRLAKQRGAEDVAGPDWNGSPTGPNTNAIGFAGRLWAIVEAGGTPVELDRNLETVGRNDFFGTLPGAFTAHPKLDPESGELHAVVYAWAEWLDHVQYVVVGRDGRVRRSVDVPTKGMTMLHDMSLTRRFAVVYDQPVTVDFELAMAGHFPFRWNPDYGNRLGFLPREADASAITWVDAPIGYCFHPLNAYDREDGSVVIDLCTYRSLFASDLRGPFGDGFARLERWVVDPAARTLRATVIDEEHNEFPRVRESLVGLPHRYGYCASPRAEAEAGWPTLKHDLVGGTRQAFDHGPGRAAGEPVFLPREGGRAEDEGWIMTFVHDLGAGATDLVLLDAADFDRGYVARVRLPERVPFGFHGNWVADRELAGRE
ncbi:MAG: carotenoid oxygenase family protein [Alphaproteobacteria bacterium]